jgi:hypothetical protein
MNGALISDIRRFAGQPGVTITDTTEHVQLRIERAEISVSVIVPRSVLEFSIEVHDAGGVCLIEDWLDYAGYDAIPAEELAEEMRAEVLLFAERLLGRSLRVSTSGDSLEWQSGERWLQAVPFVPDAQRTRE